MTTRVNRLTLLTTLFGGEDCCCIAKRKQQELSPAEKKDRIEQRRLLLDKLAFPKLLKYGRIEFLPRTHIKTKEDDTKNLFRQYDLNGDAVLGKHEMNMLAIDLVSVVQTAARGAVASVREKSDDANAATTTATDDTYHSLTEFMEEINQMDTSQFNDVLTTYLDEDKNKLISFEEFISQIHVFVKDVLDGVLLSSDDNLIKTSEDDQHDGNIRVEVPQEIDESS